MKNTALEILSILVDKYNVKLNLVNSVSFGTRYSTRLNTLTSYCKIEIMNLDVFKRTLKDFKIHNGYKIELTYIGEYTGAPQSKSWLCKRTAAELEIIRKSVEPCIGCTYSECTITNCPGLKRLAGGDTE